jgi:predicted nicotinamide N-methyase
MCRWQSLNSDAIRGASVLELGSGTGAAGLHAAGLGAKSVCLTDGGPQGLLRLLRVNVARNQHCMPSSTLVQVAPLRWGDDEPPAERYDLVIGTDVAYQAASRDALCLTLSRVLGRSGAARAVLAHEHRANAGTLEAFAEAAAARGLSCTTLHVEEGMVEDPLEVRAYAYKVSIVEVRVLAV